ncbi:hypothetical protein ACFFT9_07420, partial [Chromobacterium violaceum]|uniref:hypothetical protein n=1 Tax=Chromobacterium violaceum TaxID=536 RepID=UPI0035E6C687
HAGPSLYGGCGVNLFGERGVSPCSGFVQQRHSEMEFFNVFEYWARNCKIGVYRGINCAFADLFGHVCRFFYSALF